MLPIYSCILFNAWKLITRIWRTCISLIVKKLRVSTCPVFIAKRIQLIILFVDQLSLVVVMAFYSALGYVWYCCNLILRSIYYIYKSGSNEKGAGLQMSFHKSITFYHNNKTRLNIKKFASSRQSLNYIQKNWIRLWLRVNLPSIHS